MALFFSNCNIDTREGCEKRLAEARKLGAADGVPVVVDAYDRADWLEQVARGFEREPEKGARCARCFRYSLARTAAYAAAHGYEAFTTSLTVSPHKVSPVVFAAGEEAAWTVSSAPCGGSASAAPMFLARDFKKGDGFLRSLKRSAELGLYRQSHCGCEFSRLRRTGGRTHEDTTEDSARACSPGAGAGARAGGCVGGADPSP